MQSHPSDLIILRLLTGQRRRLAVEAYNSARFLDEPAVQAEFASWRDRAGRAGADAGCALATARRHLAAARVARHSAVRVALLGRVAYFRGRVQRQRAEEASWPVQPSAQRVAA